MVCLGLKPGAAGWKAHTNPLSYGGIFMTVKLSLLPVFEHGRIAVIVSAFKQ